MRTLVALVLGLSIAGMAAAQTITVTSPNGGEHWYPGSKHNITWTTSGEVDAVKIKLYKNGVFNRWITGGSLNTGSYAWTIPADLTLASDYSVLIYSVENFSVIDASNAMFTVEQSPIHFISPDEGAGAFPGSVFDFEWTTGTALADNVKIKLWKGNTFTWVTGGAPNTGLLHYQMPINTAYGTDYAFQIYAANDFTIVSRTNITVDPCPLQLTYPNGGENLTLNEQFTVTWDTGGLEAFDVKIKLFKDDQFFSWLSGPRPNTGSFTTTVPDFDFLVGSGYKICIYLADLFAVIDFSDASFNIVRP